MMLEFIQGRLTDETMTSNLIDLFPSQEEAKKALA